MFEERLNDDFNLRGTPVTTKDLKIYFVKSDASSYTLTVNDYKTDITDEEVSEGANAILAENVFAPGGLSLIKADHAMKVDTTKTPVEFGE